MKKVFSGILAAMMVMVLFAGCSSQKKAVEYTILDETLADEQYGVGFRKADQSLRDAVQQALCNMKKDGKLAEITKNWFGTDTSTVPDSFTPSNSTDDSLQKIKDKKTLILGLDDSFPPMGYQDISGNIVGYDIDLAKEVCSRLGVELKLQPINWEEKEMELNKGNIDCIWNGLTITDERKDAMDMTEPYMENRQVVVTLKNSKISKLTDLKDKTVALQKGSTAVDALDSRQDILSTIKDDTPVEVDNNVLAMYELRRGTSDAVVMDEVVARYYIAHLSELDSAAQTATTAQ